MNILSSLFNKKKATYVFIPNGFSFTGIKEKMGNGSLNDIAEYFGYHRDQVHTLIGKADRSKLISDVTIEVFTNNIVFLTTNKPTINVSKKEVDLFFSEITLADIFNSLETHSILENGVKNKSLDIEFLSRTLNIQNPEPNGIFFIDSLKLYLYFNDGFLSHFQPSDGLDNWARYFKEFNPTLIDKYEEVAKLFWGNDSIKIRNEINTQLNAWANIPNGWKNEYIDLHTNNLGTINFAMLLVCHYNKPITFQEFTEINYGRYKEVSLNKYKVDKFIYWFLEDGYFLKSVITA